ncbi:MAG: serine/threonine protein kinase [Clostridia bacterium]|nr:serine/threonine protein kinase [Deltaproteobacteria bacterium]
MTTEGKKIGPYNVLSEIGSGGMAVVYKAEQPSLDRLVAIKELRKELALDLSLVTRFEREAKSVASLTHQNIVHIYDFLTRANSMFIVMEFVEGIDVFELINRVGRLPPEIASIIALQAARALEYAHYRGVVHRDFKPSNLMVTKQGEVKLMDFGIARDLKYDDLTRAGTSIGTPAYMSPEQIMGERVDFRSDIFSFGIVLYQMLTGRKPFTEDDSKSVMQRILNEPYVRPRKLFPDIPWRLSRIVKKCLFKDPRKRFETTESLRRELESYVAQTVRINYAGRLVVFLRNRDLISEGEASTYVREEELRSLASKTVDSGELSSGAVVFKPLFVANAALLLLFAAWNGIVDLTKLGVANGFIHVNAVPWAEVYVNGDKYDTTPFAKPIALPPGQHIIELRNQYYEPKREPIEVEAGVTQRLRFDLTRKQ